MLTHQEAWRGLVGVVKELTLLRGGAMALSTGLALSFLKPARQKKSAPTEEKGAEVVDAVEVAPVVAEPPVTPAPAPPRRRVRNLPGRPRPPLRLHADERRWQQRMAREQRALEEARAACEQERKALRQQEMLERHLVARLRNTLALIRGYAEMLDAGDLGELATSQQYPIRIIQRRSRQLISVIEDLETLLEAADPHLPLGQVDLRKLVEDTLLTFEAECRAARLKLVKEVMLTDVYINGHAGHLQRMLENLLNNALKFTPEGGQVTVRLVVVDREAVLQVADTGVGIPRDAQERIFERFYQVSEANVKPSGSGLGLALVKEVVQAHGGRVEVESALGRGTTFTVRLPLQVEPAAQAKLRGPVWG